MAEFDVNAFTPLFLTDSVSINIHIVNIEDVVELSDSIGINIALQVITQSLLLNDEVSVNKSISLVVQDDLALTQDGRRTPHVVTTGDNVGFYQSATVTKHWPDVESDLGMIDAAAVYSAKGTYDTLALAQSVLVEKSILVAATNTLSMRNAATVYKPDQFWQSQDFVVVNP